MTRRQHVQPGKLGEMTLRRRVYLNAATMTAMHDDLFVSEKAASNARSTFGDIWTRLRGWTERDRRPCDRMRFKLVGQGHGWQWAVYPAADEADVFFEIEAKLGPIADWEIERFTEGRPAADPP